MALESLYQRSISPLTSRNLPSASRSPLGGISPAKYKVPSKYKNVESHYGGSNLSKYLNKTCQEDHPHNKKYIGSKQPRVQDNSASSRMIWSKSPKPVKEIQVLQDKSRKILDQR